MYCDFLGYFEKITFYVKSAVTAFLGKFLISANGHTGLSGFFFLYFSYTYFVLPVQWSKTEFQTFQNLYCATSVTRC